jgi:outer membrane protein TolC
MGIPLRCTLVQLILAVAATALPALAASAPNAGDSAPLSLGAAMDLAVRGQPLLEAQTAAVTAANERAVAAGQLPDPQLTLGIQDLPINTADAGSLSRDSDTQLMIGFGQAFPRGAKRQLLQARERLTGEVGAATGAALERRIRRDAGLAWLDVYYADRAAEFVAELVEQAERERGAAEIAYRTNRATQADVLAAELAVELLRDRLAQFTQDAGAARAALSRWIGGDAARSTVADLPELASPPALVDLLAALPEHPELKAAALEVESADASLGLAKQRSKPDWRLDAKLGYRPEFSEMATVMVGVDIPLFTANRQDRETAAARAAVTQAESLQTDRARQLAAEATRASVERATHHARLARFDDVILPKSRARVDATLVAYRAGQGTLAAVLDARRAALDVELTRLEIAVAVQRHGLELAYLIP